MIRYTLLTMFVAFICVYAWKDWYRALCGMIVMLAVLERPDMPRSMLGIAGLNPWNIMLLFILLAWLTSIRKEQLKWDMPGLINFLLFVYLAIVLISVGRLISDPSGASAFAISAGVVPRSTSGFVIDFIVNSLKWVIPGLLIFHGCRSEDRLTWAAATVLATTFMLGLQVVKWMPLGQLTDAGALSDRAVRVLDREIGYHRVDLAAILASGSWAFFIARKAARNVIENWALLFGGLLCLLGLALTGGRAGYLTWMLLGFVFAALRYRRYLIVGPIVLVIIVTLVPAARDRLLEGTGLSTNVEISETGETSDLYAMTSGRTLVWPIVIDKIDDRLLSGYGRQGFQQSGAGQAVINEYGSTLGFGHPHNAYLELVIDNGIVGAIPILIFFGLLVRLSLSLLRDDRSPLFSAVGGVGVALILGQLIAAMGSQSFYPRQGVVLVWCVVGIVLRVAIERRRLLTNNQHTPKTEFTRPGGGYVTS